MRVSEKEGEKGKVRQDKQKLNLGRDRIDSPDVGALKPAAAWRKLSEW